MAQFEHIVAQKPWFIVGQMYECINLVDSPCVYTVGEYLWACVQSMTDLLGIQLTTINLDNFCVTNFIFLQ